MIDYFVLLDQPRAPWLDPAELKERFHQKTLQAHPDTQKRSGAADENDSTFATLNEAYQVLQDPKRRLHHLLSLEGAAPSSSGQAVPSQLQDLFPEVGALIQRAHLLLGKISTASNAISRSLLQPEIFEIKKATTEVREKLQRLHDESTAELKAANAAWSQNPSRQTDHLSALYPTFAYLGRWTAQLEEVEFQFSLH